MRVLNPKSFIVAFAEKTRESSRWTERQYTNSSVTLRKRLRDLNDDDRTGVYSPITGNWVGGFDLSGIYTWNIVKPTVRANTSALASAEIKIDVKPRFNKDTNAELASQVALSVLELKEREQWTTQLVEYLANEMQVGPGVFLNVKHDPNKSRKHALPKWEEVEVVTGGIAICECGSQTPFDEPTEEVICAECGRPAYVEQEPQSQTVPKQTGYEEFSVGSAATNAYPFFEFRIDPVGTEGANLKKAKWFERHYPVPTDELELEYPESAESIRGADNNWSYPIKWQYTLRTGNFRPVDYLANAPYEMKEVRDIWITPSLYLNVELEEDLILKAADGKKRFFAPKGKTFADGEFEGEKFKEPPVLCFRLVGSELIDVFPSDFREEWIYTTFLSNPSTFWGLYFNELITLQDIINELLTIQMYHLRRNSITSIVYNRNSFDPEELETDLIPTKQALPHDIPIQTQFGIIPPLTLSGEGMQMIQNIMAVKGDLTLVQPAMLGEAQKGQPYAAQLLQKQQAMGSLSPASISLANGKVCWAKRQIALAQEYWTDEDTAELLKQNGEWTEEQVQLFLDCDVENELIVEFIPGSESPSTLIERELKWRQTLADLMQLASIDPSLVKPETINEILTEILQAAGVNLDFNNTEADLRLAESRYDKLLEIVRSAGVQESDPSVNQMLAQQILQAPDLQPLPFEGHGTIVEFYSDKARQEAARDVPDYLLITCLQGLIQMEIGARVQQGQLMTQAEMAVQQPMMEQQAMMQQQAMAQEQGAESEAKQLEADNAEAERQREQENRQMDREDAEADRNFQREMKMVEMADKEEDRRAKKEVKK